MANVKPVITNANAVIIRTTRLIYGPFATNIFLLEISKKQLPVRLSNFLYN